MRCLKEPRLGGGDAVPSLRVEVRGERARGVKTAGRDLAERARADDLCVDLAVPEDCKARPLRVVVEAGESHDPVVGRAQRRWVDEVQPRAHAHEAAWLRERL